MKWIRSTAVVGLVLCLAAGGATAAVNGRDHYLRKPSDWFAGADARRIAANILSYQSDLGGWPKNIDTTAAPYTGDRKDPHRTPGNRKTPGGLSPGVAC